VPHLPNTFLVQAQTQETVLLNPERLDALEDIIAGPMCHMFDIRHLGGGDATVLCQCRLSDVVMALLLYDDSMPWLDE